MRGLADHRAAPCWVLGVTPEPGGPEAAAERKAVQKQ